MSGRARRFFGSSMGSAIIGGVIVAAFGWVAIAAGWIHASDQSAPPAIAQITAPVSSHGEGEDTNVVNQIYRQDGRGVVFIEAERPAEETSPFNPFGAPEGGGVATGSGFVIDTEGHIITNNHVVEGANRIEVKIGSSDEAQQAKLVGADPATDVALLQVEVPSDQLHPLALGDSSKVEVGEPVVAIGNPFGLDRTVTSGIVSALQRQIQAPNGFAISHVIQTDAAINPGNSGGPLIDSEGRVIGINSQIQTGGSNGNVGIGFAVPINTAREVVEQLEEHGKVEHAYLGIEGSTIGPDLARALHLPVQQGVLVNSVVKGGPADSAGVHGGTTSATIEGAEIRLGGDIITEIDGKKIAGMDDLINVVNGGKPGETVDLTVVRGGHTKKVTVTLGVRPSTVEAGQAGR